MPKRAGATHECARCLKPAKRCMTRVGWWYCDDCWPWAKRQWNPRKPLPPGPKGRRY